ncbi:hypothetical protein Tco_0139977 [Tanacetum coccineum]
MVMRSGGWESSAAGTVRRVGLPQLGLDPLRIADTLEAAPGAGCLESLGYGIRDTWDDLVGAIPEIFSTDLTLRGTHAVLLEEEPDFTCCLGTLDGSMFAIRRIRWGYYFRTTVLNPAVQRFVEVTAADQRRQTVIFRAAEADYRVAEAVVV